MKKFFDKLYRNGMDEFNKILEGKLTKEEKFFIITANPETFMIAEKDTDYKKMIFDDKTFLVPDGIGIVKAANYLKYNIKERITGIDIAAKLLEYANKYKKSIYLFGASEKVITDLVNLIKNDYKNIKIAGYTDGYVKDKDSVFDKISKKKPDIVLVALGIPLQENLIYKHYSKFDKGIFVGVGGSFDVLSGNKKRAPKIFIKLNLEWLYRITKEPKRLKRFYDSNIRFLFKIKKYK